MLFLEENDDFLQIYLFSPTYYCIFLCGSPSLQRITTLPQIISVGRENFPNFPKFSLCYLDFFTLSNEA